MTAPSATPAPIVRAPNSEGVNRQKPNEPDPKRARIPLAEQEKEAHRELGDRYKRYSARVKAGKMTQEAADLGIARMRAIRDTLRLFARFEDEVRATVAHCLKAEDVAAEVEILKQNPAVQAVLAAFPGADVRPPEDPSRARSAAGIAEGDPDRASKDDPPPFDPEPEEAAA